ncbi:elongation factor P--(R)-beta-lysine ligase, partial [Candidatus Peregrinibacteria bacterium]|nr:elongation factor P--(R)-beta-lysine ligase [Candidatus Peregrinibacteria bacterium]
MIYDKPIAVKRSELLQKTRDFFSKKDFLEVETPIITRIPGMEPYLTPFETKF